MKRLILVAVMVLVMTMTSLAWGASGDEPHHHQHHRQPVPARCTVQALKPFAAYVWSLDKWERGEPSEAVLEAYSRRLACAPPAHAKAMKNVWHFAQDRYFSHRHTLMWREHYKPFVYPDGSRWAVPYPIALCESGGNYYVGPSGAYGLIPPFPQYMDPKTQDEVAHNLYEEQGEGPWAPYESGCAYR